MAKFKVGDKVRILDGSKIPNYTGGWNKEHMGRHVGKEYKIEAVHEHWYKSSCAGYRLNTKGMCTGCIWDERGLELVTKQKIVITTDGTTTTAALYDGKQKVKSAKAKCAPSDTFDFNYGASLALDRLTGFVRGSIDNTLSQMDRFLAGEIALEVPTNKIMDFLKECERLGLKWHSGCKPTEYNPGVKYFVYENNHLFYSVTGRDNSNYIWETWNGETSEKKNIAKSLKDIYETLQILLAIKEDFDDD